MANILFISMAVNDYIKFNNCVKENENIIDDISKKALHLNMLWTNYQLIKYDIIKICYRTQLRPNSYKKNSYGLWQEHIINKISI